MSGASNISPLPVSVSADWQVFDGMQTIASLLNDDDVVDILINGPKNIYVERNGKLEKTDCQFSDVASLDAFAHSIAQAIGRSFEKDHPIVDARLPDGSRVNIIAPPLAVDGVMISIRKFSRRTMSLDDIVRQQGVSAPLGEFLKIAGRSHMNVMIAGGTGSGKTTLLNAISHYIATNERIVTIEDSLELQLQQPHVVRLETTDDIPIRNLVRNALRMRPDRIIVGEVRGEEAFDMMQAMNTGHEGSLTTIHANHPRDALARLENMISMCNLNIPQRTIRAQIASSLHLIIQTSRMSDGIRRVTYVSEIVGMEGDMITMNDLFTFKTSGEDSNGRIQGVFEWSGILPRTVRRIAYYGELEHLSQSLGVKIPKMQ